MKLPHLLANRPGSADPAGGAYDPNAHLQWWYFDAVLESGHRLLSFFLPRFLGSLEGNEFDLPMMDIVLRAPDGAIVRERRFFPQSELKASRDRFAADFGPDCSVRFDPGEGGSAPGLYRLRAGGTGKICYELEITPELPPWAPTRNGRLPRVFLMLLRRSLTTRDSFHYVPFAYREATPVKQPYWGQTVADAEVEVVLKKDECRFKAQGVLETMVTGSRPGVSTTRREWK